MTILDFVLVAMLLPPAAGLIVERYDSEELPMESGSLEQAGSLALAEMRSFLDTG